MKKILVVDDSLFMRNILKNILSEAFTALEKSRSASKGDVAQGYKILEADTGARALKQFRKENPDLILLDIIMPEGEEEGVTVLKEIIKTDPGAQVVMITAVGQNLIREECLKLGARDYIVKPFDEKQVAEVVAKYLG